VSRGDPPDILEIYFDWLYDQIYDVRDLDSPYSYLHVLMHLHTTEFNDKVPNDDNRTAQGEELRNEFLSGLPVVYMEDYAKIESLGKASVLEVLVALSRQADYIAEIGAKNWAQKFLENLNLDHFPDSRFREPQGLQIKAIIDLFNNRKYTSNGHGGIFPLEGAHHNQRRRELWYQMADYITEQGLY
jgi:hypothetical protein